MMTSRTAQTAVPSVLIKAYGKLGPGQWIDVTSSVILFNPATGKDICKFLRSRYVGRQVSLLFTGGETPCVTNQLTACDKI